MHIVLVTHHYAPEVGAPQRRWRELVARFVAAGHRVTVIAPPPHHPGGRAVDLADDERPGAVGRGPSGETVLRVGYLRHGPGLVSRSLDQAWTSVGSVLVGFRRLRGDRRPDVVVATAPGIPSLGAGLALARRRLRPVPLVVEMRDAWPDVLGHSGVLGRGRRGAGALLWRAVQLLVTRWQRGAAAVVTTTASFADVLRDRGVARVEVVRNSAPLGSAPACPLPGSRPALHVLYLGTTGRSQGLGTGVRAAALLRARGVPVELRIVGAGVDRDALRALATALGAPVEFPAPAGRAEVAAHYDWADTVLVPLRAWDAFEWTVPSKLYEALVSGRHVSAALAGEAARVVLEARAGDVVPPESPESLADLWQSLVADRARLDVADRGRRWVATHADFDHLAAHYLRVLADVAGAAA